MQPMQSNQENISRVIRELHNLGENGLLVITSRGIGTMRKPSGEAIEVTPFDENKLLTENVEENQKNLRKIQRLLQDGRVIGAKQDGDFVIRQDVATNLGLGLGKNVTLRLRTDLPVAQQIVLQGRIQAASEGDYDKVNQAIDALIESLISVKNQPTDNRQPRPTRIGSPPAPPLRQETVRSRQEAKAGNNKKTKKDASIHTPEDVKSQEKADKQRRKYEKARQRKAEAKKEVAEDALEFDKKQEQIKQARKDREVR